MYNPCPLIIAQLEHELATALSASEDAHSTATHSENIAENKYDTLAVEAAYLAHGQSMRIVEIRESIHLYQHFKRPLFTPQSSIQLGAIVDIENDNGEIHYFFIGPAAGGLQVNYQNSSIRVITTGTPLGKALLNKHIDDEISLTVNNHIQTYTMINIH